MTRDLEQDNGEAAGAIWVRTTPGPGLTYEVTLEIDPDTHVVLDDEQALAHARAVGASIARAEHDALVNAQLRLMLRGAPRSVLDGKDADDFVAAQIQGLRDAREVTAWPTVLKLLPGVSLFTGGPFLVVTIRDERVGAWRLEDARRHIGHVFECLDGRFRDEAYLRLLVETFGLDEPTARRAVAALSTATEPGAPS